MSSLTSILEALENGHMSLDEFKAALSALIDEVIGGDEVPDIPATRHPGSKPGYSLRATVINGRISEQRSRKEQLLK